MKDLTKAKKKGGANSVFAADEDSQRSDERDQANGPKHKYYRKRN